MGKVMFSACEVLVWDAVKGLVVAIMFCMLLSGCVTSSIIQPQEIINLQTQTKQLGDNSYGCIRGNLQGSSGVVGGMTNWLITWGDDSEVIKRMIDVCVPR